MSTSTPDITPIPLAAPVIPPVTITQVFTVPPVADAPDKVPTLFVTPEGMAPEPPAQG